MGSGTGRQAGQAAMSAGLLRLVRVGEARDDAAPVVEGQAEIGLLANLGQEGTADRGPVGGLGVAGDQRAAVAVPESAALGLGESRASPFFAAGQLVQAARLAVDLRLDREAQPG